MFEDLKKNLEHEKKIVEDMKSIAIGLENDATNRDFYNTSLVSLAQQLDLLNNAVPELLKEWCPDFGANEVVPESVEPEVKEPEGAESEVRKLEVKEPEKKVSKIRKLKKKEPKRRKSKNEIKKIESVSYARQAEPADRAPAKVPVNKNVNKNVVKMSYVSPSTKEKKLVTINKKDRKEFLKKLKLSEEAMLGIKKMKEESGVVGIRKPNAYIGFSSKYFGKYADKYSTLFSEVSKDLKSANISILLTSYLSMAMMSSAIAFVVGFLVFGILLAFNFPANWIFFPLPLGFVGLTLAGFYFYPASEASSAHKNISYELPFSTIHMAAIAGSNITPVKIFKIIAASKEYPNIGAEMKKVVVQIDVYGYDMVTSLKNVAKTTRNKRLSELFSGLATNISSGGALKNYLEKKSQSFLVDYRIEREKYAALAGTFMDVYISILIAAPLVLMMMFILMNVAGLGMGGLGIMALMGLAIGGIIMANIVFIVVLNLKQPRV